MKTINLSHISYIDIPDVKNSDKFKYGFSIEDLPLRWILYFNNGMKIDLRYKIDQIHENIKNDTERRKRFNRLNDSYNPPKRPYEIFHNIYINQKYDEVFDGEKYLQLFEDEFVYIIESNINKQL